MYAPGDGAQDGARLKFLVGLSASPEEVLLVGLLSKGGTTDGRLLLVGLAGGRL